MPDDLSWDDLRIVLAVGRGGSHGAAGRTLRIDPTTVGRRVGAAERALGTRLFDRTPGGLVATPEGAILLARAARVEEEVLAAERELGGVDARLEGPVRITASDGLLTHALLPALGELRRAHPGITAELRADTRALDLSRREADVAVRLGRPTAPSLVARRLGAFTFALYASRAYLARRGAPRSAVDLAAAELIGFDASLDEHPQVRWLAKTAGTVRYAVRATTTSAQLAACLEGHGIALFASFIASREPALVPILPSLRSPPRDVWLAVHEDMKKNARVVAVTTWLGGVAALRG